MTKILLTLPAWTDKRTGKEHDALTEECTLVDVLLANTEPNSEEVLKYYGVQAPPSVYKPLMFDRMILEREDGTFVVMPNTEKNKRLWKKLEK